MQNTDTKTDFTIYRNEMREFISEDVFDWRHKFFEKFTDYLCSNGIDTNIESAKTFEINLNGNKNEIAVRDSIAFIQNNSNDNYYVLDCHDWIKPDDTKLIVQDPRCIKVLKCQYNNSYFKKPIYDKIKTWTYFDRYWPSNEERFIKYRDTKPTINKLYFRGVAWGHRIFILDELIKQGVMNSDYDPIDFNDYLHECSQHRIMLSLPGLADVCHRDIEGFAAGACVLRPKILNQFHNDLIPDYHYISIDIDVINTDPMETAKKIEQRFREVIDDNEFLDSISENAMKWFDENVRCNNVMKLTAELLNLNNS